MNIQITQTPLNEMFSFFERENMRREMRLLKIYKWLLLFLFDSVRENERVMQGVLLGFLFIKEKALMNRAWGYGVVESVWLARKMGSLWFACKIEKRGFRKLRKRRPRPRI